MSDSSSTQQSERTAFASARVVKAYPALTEADRCDRCGAQAFTRAISADTGAQLLFCNHHGREHVPALREQEWKVLGRAWV